MEDVRIVQGELPVDTYDHSLILLLINCMNQLYDTAIMAGGWATRDAAR